MVGRHLINIVYYVTDLSCLFLEIKSCLLFKIYPSSLFLLPPEGSSLDIAIELLQVSPYFYKHRCSI